MENYNNQFLKLCQDFEQAVNFRYNLKNGQNTYTFLGKVAEFREHESNLESIRHIRNIFSHARTIGGEDIAYVSKGTMEYFTELIEEIENPPRAIQLATVNINSASLKANVLSVMNEMETHGFSHIPIEKSGRVVGVFSENSLFQYLKKFKGMDIQRSMRIEDLKEFIRLDTHTSYYYEFVSEDTPLPVLKNMFNTRDKFRRKLAMIFVTKRGIPEENVLGIITPWDVVDLD